tara:strand:- start:400 stop:621 length:222 start_codon:yes stop_codon:yes gene_type:complete
MGKVDLNHLKHYDEFDEEFFDLDEKFGGTEKIKRNNERLQKNNDEDGIHEPQRLPPGWREGDSYIGLRKKARR